MANPNPSLLAYPEFPEPITATVLNQLFRPRTEELRWVWQTSSAPEARLGLLCGLAMLLSVLSLDTIHLCLLRFAFHAAAPIDGQIAYFFAQEQTLITAQTQVIQQA